MADDAAAPDGELSGSIATETTPENEIHAKRSRGAGSPLRLATLMGLVVVLAMAGLTGWLGYQAYKSYEAQQQRDQFLAVARQGAVNFSTLDYTQVDTDVQRILDSATGTFYDDFATNSQPYIDVLKQAKSKSVGTVTAAGLESETDNDAQVLVTLTVKTSNAGGVGEPPRSWRMRISLHKVGDQTKVSNAEFVK